MKKTKMKKLSFEKISGLDLTTHQSKDIKGGQAAWTGGCSDGCPSFFETSFNCTYGNCTADCSGEWNCFTTDACTGYL